MTGSVRCAAVALFAAAVWATSTFAQDPRASTVQGVAREWLLLADRLDASATWQAAGPRFQKAITESRWAEGLAREREPRGAIVRRAVAGTSFGTKLPGITENGNFALVKFRTSFARRAEGAEQVSLELGADERWRVIGYVIL